MKKVIEFLRGKKTYAVAVAIGVVVVSEYLGWIDAQTAITLYGLLSAGGVASLRDAIRPRA